MILNDVSVLLVSAATQATNVLQWRTRVCVMKQISRRINNDTGDHPGITCAMFSLV